MTNKLAYGTYVYENLLPAACPAPVSRKVHAHCIIFLCFDNQRIANYS